MFFQFKLFCHLSNFIFFLFKLNFNFSDLFQYAPPSASYRGIEHWVRQHEVFPKSLLTRQISAQLEFVPTIELTHIPLISKSGAGVVTIADDFNEQGSRTVSTVVNFDASRYPTVIADRIYLTRGKWFYEIKFQHFPPDCSCSFGVADVGWEDADWTAFKGVGDDKTDLSMEQRSARSYSAFRVKSSDHVKGIKHILIAFDLNVRTMSVSVNDGPEVEVLRDFLFHAVTPAFSFQGVKGENL